MGRVDDDAALERFEQIVLSQRPAETPWEPVTDYTPDARMPDERRTATLLRSIFQPAHVVDAGAGFGYLVRALQEQNISAWGFDAEPHPPISRGSLTDPSLPRSLGDLVVCREVLEHLPVRGVRQAVTNLCRMSTRYVYVTTRFAKDPDSLLTIDTADTLDPTHITMLNQTFLRVLFVLEGFKRRADLESLMDWKRYGRVLVYERA